VRRLDVDIAILAALGRFFAGKMRAAVWFELFASTGTEDAIDRALTAYRSARTAWASIVETAGVYVDDLTFGPEHRLRGHWRDRLDAIDADLDDMQRLAASAHPGGVTDPSLAAMLETLAEAPPSVRASHEPPSRFEPGAPIHLSMELEGASEPRVELRYRPMNQALRMSTSQMDRQGNAFLGVIPGDVADGLFPITYAFVIRDGGRAWRHPGIGPELASQPYFVVRPARSS
jgi:hypothetical protein